MAANFETSHNKGSDVVFDVCCSVCEEDSIHKEGLFYCQKCSKTFCNECVLMHNKIFKDHSVSGKGECDNFPVKKPADDTLELCEEHSSQKLTMFCEDHEQLLCQLCQLHNHRQCSQVVLLAEKCKSSTNPFDVAKMASNIERLQKRLVEAVKKSEQNIKSLQTSYEIILEEILDFRRKINDSLDRLQQNTVNELDKLHSSLKNSLEDERKQCETFISKLKLHDTNITKSPEKSLILCRKYLDQIASAELFLQTNPTADIEFQHSNDLKQFLAACTDLGKITSRVVVVSHQQVDPNKVINVQGKTQFKVRTKTDMTNCTITGIFEMPNGNLVISDCENQSLKLLDQTYNVIDQIQLPASAWSICNTSPNEVAVTVSDRYSLNEIHFLRVDNGKIIAIKTVKLPAYPCSMCNISPNEVAVIVRNERAVFVRNEIHFLQMDTGKMTTKKLNHGCFGIAHHKGNMFLTSGTALFQYTIDGRLVKQLYEDTSACESVAGVVVSPDGKRIYLSDRHNSRLVTLTMDGAVIATLQDTAFKHFWIICNIHVAATGHVFVFGNTSVSQVDTDGKQILATVDADGRPVSVNFNVDRSTFLVGMDGFRMDGNPNGNDSMTEFQTIA